MNDSNNDMNELDLERERDVLFGVISRFIGYFTRDSQRLSQNDAQSEYPFVPMDPRQVYAQVKLAQDYLRPLTAGAEPARFLDIGCGIGNILLFAEQMDFEVWGIEKDPFPYKVAAKLVDSRRVISADIWEYEDYGQFRVIYYFRPFHEGNTQRRFERFIEDQLQPGGILIANRKMSNDIDDDPRFRRLRQDLPVWVKGEGGLVS